MIYRAAAKFHLPQFHLPEFAHRSWGRHTGVLNGAVHSGFASGLPTRSESAYDSSQFWVGLMPGSPTVRGKSHFLPRDL
jgi:hypothetical protein